MVKGLARFRDHFQDYPDRYLLFGGTACDLLFTEAGLEFRATRDLDIVLILESMDSAFAEAFWKFVKAGGYRQQEISRDRKVRYRFQKPTHPDFPTMLELFSRIPEALTIDHPGHLTPISLDGDISNLSAILLHDEDYQWITHGRRILDGISIVGPEHLIPLKANAWLDLRDRKASGENIDSKNIK